MLPVGRTLNDDRHSMYYTTILCTIFIKYSYVTGMPVADESQRGKTQASKNAPFFTLKALRIGEKVLAILEKNIGDSLGEMWAIVYTFLKATL